MRPANLLSRSLVLFALLLQLVLSTYTQLDQSILANGGLLWSGFMPINSGTVIEDQDLSNLAREAYKEMALDFQYRRSNSLLSSRLKERPTVLAALVNPGGTKIYFSTNIKGLQNALVVLTARGGLDAKIIQALNRCQLSSELTDESTRTDILHVNKAACAELFVSHQYFLDVGGDVEISGSRVVAVQGKGTADNPTVELKPFCDAIPNEPARGTYGCTSVMDDLGVEGVSTQVTDDPIRPDIGLGIMAQIPLC